MISDELKQKLEVDKVRFYTHRTPLVNNVFTVCLLISGDNVVKARGVSICSVLDIYNRKIGKKKALSRAIRAIIKEETDLPINDEISRWFNWGCVKQLKIKSEEVSQKFKDEIVPILDGLGVEHKITAIDTKNGQTQKAYFVVPRIYPLLEAKKFFDYKSYHMPDLNKVENCIVQKIATT